MFECLLLIRFRPQSASPRGPCCLPDVLCSRLNALDANRFALICARRILFPHETSFLGLQFFFFLFPHFIPLVHSIFSWRFANVFLLMWEIKVFQQWPSNPNQMYWILWYNLAVPIKRKRSIHRTRPMTVLQLQTKCWETLGRSLHYV